MLWNRKLLRLIAAHGCLMETGSRDRENDAERIPRRVSITRIISGDVRMRDIAGSVTRSQHGCELRKHVNIRYETIATTENERDGAGDVMKCD